MLQMWRTDVVDDGPESERDRPKMRRRRQEDAGEWGVAAGVAAVADEGG